MAPKPEDDKRGTMKVGSRTEERGHSPGRSGEQRNTNLGTKDDLAKKHHPADPKKEK